MPSERGPLLFCGFWSIGTLPLNPSPLYSFISGSMRLRVGSSGKRMRLRNRFPAVPKMARLSALLSTLSWQILKIGAFSDANLVPRVMKKRAFSEVMYPVHVFNSL